MHEGEAVVEMVNTIHHGENRGSKPVILYMFYLSDTKMKAYFYPDLDKSVLFEHEYIYERSGHTRGSTVDLTLFDMATEKPLDTEWWHFTLRDEPFPDTYFTFPVKKLKL